ncbi:MAG: HAD hydrolase-like protein [Lachnospiraceae bacterium]|nr:HAD hydrolase-like protein [Lachnospiraceae bacterium]
MASVFDRFEKNKEYLICVDSDGCAMDTMNSKHIKCFGPCMVEEWGLKEWEEAILARWNDINLYTMTRGINRFQGLLKALKEIDGQYVPIEGLDDLEQWVENTPELSNGSLKKEIERTGSAVLKKALRWSEAVNTSIQMLDEKDKQPFAGVKEALSHAHRFADIAIVSSANLQAVMEEWDVHGLLEHTDIVLAQDAGSKAYCIGELLKKGYEKDKVLMTGDAPGDYKAAQSNGVFYYPILVRHEAESWAEFKETAVSRLSGGSYEGAYQQEKVDAFLRNLGAE